MALRLVAGLGNPGETYRGTRHNVGYDVVDLLARRNGAVFEVAPVHGMEARWRREGGAVLLFKSLGFMNLSGEAVAGLARYYKVDVADLFVVCDDVNLPLGRLRIRASGTEGGHNGLRSIAAALGTIDYARLRIGVGRGDMRRDLADHVLARFEPEERPGVDVAIDRAAEAAEMWVDRGVEAVMNSYNRVEELPEG